MGFWSVALPIAANFAGDLFSQASARSAYRTRYQDTVKDMRKAGLNPALAYGQNPGGGAQTADFGDAGDAGTKGMAAAANAKQAASTTRLTNAQAGLLEAQTDDLVASTHARALVDQQLPDRQRFENIAKEMEAIIAQRTNARQTATYNSDVEADLAKNRKAVIDALVAKHGIPRAEAEAAFYRGLGRWQPYLGSAKDIAQIIQALRSNR